MLLSDDRKFYMAVSWNPVFVNWMQLYNMIDKKKVLINEGIDVKELLFSRLPLIMPQYVI